MTVNTGTIDHLKEDAIIMHPLPRVDEINADMRMAAANGMSGIVEYSEAPLVSSDIIGNPHSAIFDSLSTIAEGDGYAKIIAWYDNEWGYSSRIVDLIDKLASIDG